MNCVIDYKSKDQSREQDVIEEPGAVKVFLHNDDFTPMKFVIEALIKFFHLDDISAKSVTQEAHTKGRAVCGTYISKDIAETRIDQASEFARTHDHPLKWSMEAT